MSWPPWPRGCATPTGCVLAGLRRCGAELVGDVVRYGDTYRLCYVRGPAGIIIELAEEVSAGAAG